MGTVKQNPTPELLTQVIQNGVREPMLFYRDGEPVAAFISIEDFELLRAKQIAGLLAASDRIADRVQEIGIDEETLSDLLAE